MKRSPDDEGKVPVDPTHTEPAIVLERLRRQLVPAGLNAIGVVGTTEYDNVAPEARRTAALFEPARSIIVIGSGGRLLWDAFVADLRACPQHLTQEQHPLDAFVRRQICDADRALGSAGRRWFWAAADADIHLDFRVLAELAHLGCDSRLRLLLHPTFGPWFGLRAACFTDLELRASESIAVDHCADCDAPCVAACPGAALASGRWDVDVCSRFHEISSECADTCYARAACPAGRSHRYEPDQIRYHYNRAAGRQWLRSQIACGVDAYEGSGPYWNSWKERVDLDGDAADRSSERSDNEE